MVQKSGVHHLIGSFSNDLQRFIHPRWFRIFSINSRTVEGKLQRFYGNHGINLVRSEFICQLVKDFVQQHQLKRCYFVVDNFQRGNMLSM